jgi:N6-adenosine-specific RNA methylase IME4
MPSNAENPARGQAAGLGKSSCSAADAPEISPNCSSTQAGNRRAVPLSRNLGLRGIMSRTGWELPDDLSEAEWRVAGGLLGKIEHSVSWWIGDWWAFGEHKYGDRKAIVEADDWEGPGFQTCADAAYVCKAVETSRRREVLSFNHHREVAALKDPAQKDRWLATAEKDNLSVMKLRAAIKQRAALDRTHAVEFDAKALGRFAVIYADPPWRYEHPPMGGSSRSIENHFPTMDLDEICALQVADIAFDNAILFLWATAPKLCECMKVIDAWGFVYRTEMVWVKDKIGMGYYIRNRHENLLICRRGDLPPPAESARGDSVVEAPRLEHSAKPEIFYDIIDGMYPGLRKIELFSRSGPREEWTFWGNQASAS